MKSDEPIDVRSAGRPAAAPPVSPGPVSPGPVSPGPVSPGPGSSAPGSSGPVSRARVDGLDGLRGLAALFVVLHHSFLFNVPGFPYNTGPFWLSWLSYGHFAVAVFITLSGFSLGISPARKGWTLGGKARFAQRRAWRILPPYWAALVYSLIIAWAIVPQPDSGPPTGKSVVVYSLLLQDIFGSPTPNSAFWSIAVEAQLYLFFPLLLLLLRRYGGAVMLTAVTIPVVAIGLLAPHSHLVNTLLRLTPQFAPLFGIGLLAAGIVRAGDRIRRLPLGWLSGLAAVPVIALIAAKGTVWTVGHFFWVDLAAAPAIALLLAAVATDRPAALVWLLDTRPVRSLGRFSYSLYLVHAPIVVVVWTKLIAPHYRPGVTAFGLTLAVAVPVSLVFARLFAAVFEIPFQRYRSWTALRAAISAKMNGSAAPQSARAPQPPTAPQPAGPPHEPAPLLAEAVLPAPAREP
jgi:peptidoglycan/LPS O-acetylase OafA/YrhL